MPDQMPRQPHGSALDKAIATLEAVTAYGQPVSLAELSSSLALPRQTVHRILQQLSAAGLIKRALEKDRYSVGPRLSKLATDTLVATNRDATVRSVLQSLVADINETCNIGILDGLDFVYLERIESDWPLRVHLQAGSRVPAYCTSGGKAMLAHLPSRPRKRLLKSRPLKSHSQTTVTDLKTLEKEFEDCRQEGFAINNEEFTPGIIGIAVPVLGSGQQPIAALACHAPSARVSLGSLQNYVPDLQAAARRLSEIWN